MPDFTLPAISGETVSLTDFAGKNLVLSFIPAAWTPVCSDQWPGYNIIEDIFAEYNAALVGISVERMVLYSFMIAAMVGAIGGAILAPLTLTSYDRGILLGLKGFAACILGGLGNPFGAAAGGLILGVLESFGAGLISSAYKDAFAFIILLILLFVKPSGLFGQKSAERV